MSISQRPVHPPASLPAIAPIEPVDSKVQPSDEPSKGTETAPDPGSRPVRREAATAPIRRPLYRREPWLAVLLAGFVITAGAVFVPDGATRIVALLGLAVGAIGVILLMIHKPDPAEEARWQE